MSVAKAKPDLGCVDGTFIKNGVTTTVRPNQPAVATREPEQEKPVPVIEEPKPQPKPVKPQPIQPKPQPKAPEQPKSDDSPAV
jgi:outer membrane biosynthesis protein TonB